MQPAALEVKQKFLASFKNEIFFSLILVFIFIRPFISSLAFASLDYSFSLGFLILMAGYIVQKKVYLLKLGGLVRPLGLLILALFSSVALSRNEPNSSSEFYKYISCLLLFLIVVSLNQPERLAVIRTIVYSGLLISLFAVYQYLFGFRNLADYITENRVFYPFAFDYLKPRRVFFPFVTPGILGGYLALAIPLCLINKRYVWFTLPLSIALFLTKSLIAVFSLLLGLIIYLLLKGSLKNKIMRYIPGVLIAAFAVIFVLRSQSLKDHTHPLFSLAMRLGYWKDTLGMIKAHPFIGSGIGNFNLQASRYAHNSYLQLWAETGIVGLAAYIWLLYSVLKNSFKNWGKQSGREEIWLVVACVVFLIDNLFNFTLFLPEIAFIWWIIFGLIAAREAKSDKSIS